MQQLSDTGTNGAAELREWRILPKLRPETVALRLEPNKDRENKGKLTPFLSHLQDMLATSPRSKIKEFYQSLRERGYAGSYDLVKKKIQSFRRELGQQAAQLYASPERPQAQVELGKVLLKSGDREIKACLFTMVLGHSGRFYAEMVEGCDMVRFLECHRNAFNYFGGVPSTLYYDPGENPLLRKLVGGYPFHLPVVHCGQHYGYGVQPTPAFAPWMKGRLKRPVKILKKFFFPGYAFASLEKANLDLLDWFARPLVPGADKQNRFPRENMGPLPSQGFNIQRDRRLLRLRA